MVLFNFLDNDQFVQLITGSIYMLGIMATIMEYFVIENWERFSMTI
jgi:hypothetical protein